MTQHETTDLDALYDDLAAHDGDAYRGILALAVATLAREQKEGISVEWESPEIRLLMAEAIRLGHLGACPDCLHPVEEEEGICPNCLHAL